MPRGSKPGERRGGIKKGTVHRKTAEFRATVLEKLREMNCDPIEGLAAIANDANTSIDCRAKILVELAQYVYPKLTRAEITGPSGGAIQSNSTIRVVYVNKPEQIDASDA